MSNTASNISRDGRAATAFAAEYALAEQLGPEATEELSHSTTSLLEWIKAFRRTLTVAKKYPASHPHREQVHARLAETTATHLDRFRELELHFYPDDTRSREGFRIPAATEQELDAYTFFPLYRDGIEMLRLRHGVGRPELDVLVKLVASGGLRQGDDAYLWLWKERFTHVDVRVEPKLNAHLAIGLTVRGSMGVSADAFLSAFRAASPSYRPDDTRGMFTTASFGALAQQGLDADRANEMLTAPDPERLLPAFGNDERTATRELLANPAEVQARVDALRNQHFGD